VRAELADIENDMKSQLVGHRANVLVKEFEQPVEKLNECVRKVSLCFPQVSECQGSALITHRCTIFS